MTGTPAVQCTGVTVAYGGHTALSGCDLALPEGATTALVGPNGSGKSTLLSAIAGLVRPTAGALVVLGRPPGHSSLARRVAYVLQTTPANAVLPVTVREVVTMARYAQRGMFGRLTPEDRGAVEHAMDMLEITDLADRHLRELSGGQRQRVLVAQGLAQGGDLLLLDEPVSGLDLTSRERILDVVERVRADGGTVVVATHDLGDAERADHVVLLAGRVVAAGPPSEVVTVANLRDAYGSHRRITEHEVPARIDEHVHPAALRPSR